MTRAQSSASGERIALITGASGGIGLAAGRALVRAGYRVVGTSRQAAPDEVRDGMRMLRCDVTSDEDTAATVAKVVADYGRIDVLVNNAGRGIAGAAEDSSIEQIHRLFDTNFYGLVRMTNAMLPIMRRQRSGRIVNVSSVIGFLPGPFMSYYAATKHAVEGYSESLDHEVRQHGIRVVLVEPSWTRTSFEQSLAAADRPLDVYRASRATAAQVINEAMKIGASAETVAATIVEAATSATPKLRYPAGRRARNLSIMRRLIPARMFDRSFRAQMQLP